MNRQFTKQPIEGATNKCPVAQELTNVIYNMLDDEFMDNIAVRLASEVTGYDPEWVEDAYPVGSAEIKLEEAQLKFAKALTDYLTAGYQV